MFVLARALTYASLFVGLLLVFVPAQLLDGAGIARPTQVGAVEVLGLVMAATGGALALWCVLSFSRLGCGTPAPFDPPRRLVRQGPYRHVRNPMYLGAVIALSGAAVFYGSVAVLGYAAGFLLAAHLFVRGYEEPTLTRLFGDQYLAYRAQVPRWWPRVRNRARLRAVTLLLAMALPPQVTANAGASLRIVSGVTEAGDATELWLAMIRKRLPAEQYQAIAPLRKPLTAARAVGRAAGSAAQRRAMPRAVVAADGRPTWPGPAATVDLRTPPEADAHPLMCRPLASPRLGTERS